MVPDYDVLLVEDDGGDEEMTSRALHKMDPEPSVKVARDGAQAVEALLDGPKDLPRLVLLDLKLPKLSGFDVLQRLRTSDRTKAIPVVVLTSSDVPQDVQRCENLGANGFVIKPIDFVEYNEAITSVTSYWLGARGASLPRSSLFIKKP